MKRSPLFFFIAVILVLLISCENNVYIDDSIDRNIWRVGDGESAVYFDTANNAIAYIIENISTSRAVVKTDDPMRTVTLMRPVLSEGSDGIIEEDYGKYILGDEYRGSINIPSEFTGDLCIDFNGNRYDFSNNSEAFFVIDGGDNVYIYNGTSVIFNEASHIPYAIVVDTKTVTIDEHLLDDRRNDPKAVSVKGTGSVVITSSSSRENTSIKGAFDVGGELRIEDGVIYIESIETEENSTFIITGGEIHNPHDYDEIVLPAIDAKEFEKNGGKHGYIHTWNTTPYKEEIVKEATCIEEGLKKAWYKCIECDEVTEKEETIPKSDHKHTGAWITTDEKSHWRICPVCEEKIDEAEHTFSQWIENSQGVWTRYCEVCLRKEENAHITHTIVNHPKTDPTCTEDGNTEYWECSVCGECFSDKEGTKSITKESTVIEKLGHDWDTTSWTSDNSTHWHKCKRENCTAKNNEAEHTNEYFYSALEKTEEGIPFLTISHRCIICGKEVSTDHTEEDGVFHLTPLDGFTYTYDKTTSIVTIRVASYKQNDSFRWYDIDGKSIDVLGNEIGFAFNLRKDKYGFRCETINKDGKIVNSSYIELW